ncbi:MAG: Sua5 yciO yrdC, YrdC domain protein [Actinomycetia bacterium]|nr:Sua5 yciO yrdC, YrdC domain protein [Actinomycetes bacterium]
MSARYDCADAQQREAGILASVTTVKAGGLVVLPTDTVYGLGADAFSPDAVSRLLAARGQERRIPPSVLVGSVRAASALAETLGAFGQDLIDEFWPGPLTLVFRASSTLKWDLGDTNGTVAVRMPLHPVALELLRRTGPLAVSSASKTGQNAATTAADAQEQLGESVEVYLDGGPCADSVPSTIVDLTAGMPRVLRVGAVSVDQLRKVATVIDLPSASPAGEPPAAPVAEAAPAASVAEADPADPVGEPGS